MNYKIVTELENIRKNYDKTIDILDGLPFSQKNQIKTIEFYSNNKYLNGQKDELGREKPFMQILNAICDVEDAAKDINTSDIQISSDDSNHYLESFLMTKDVYVWMKDTNFAKTINDMRSTHTRYGSLLVKKVIEKDKNGKRQLYISIPEWKNLVTDQVDIINSPIVETHYLTAHQIYKKKDVWKNVSQVLDLLKNQSSTKRVPVYEVRGTFNESFINELDGKKGGNKTYSYQLFYIIGLPKEDRNNNDDDAFIPVYWENDTEQVYKYLARKPKAGRAFGVGVFEEGEEAQVWTNDAILKQNRAMEYTTKVIAQTASKKLKGRNLLTETDDGTILEHEENKPISAINLLPSGGLNQYNNLITQWYNQLERTTSAYSAQRGETPLSGTPFRLQATVLQQSSSVFKTLQQELGIFLTEIFEDWVIPFLSEGFNKEHILAYDFSPEELKEIDEKFSISMANAKVKELILSGEMPTKEDYENFITNYDEFIKSTKSKRFIKIPKDFYKNMNAKVTVNVTGEQRNKAATLESLNNILTVYASNPNLSNDPVASSILLKIVELSGAGISPITLSSAINAKAKDQQLAQEEVIKMQPQIESKPLSLEANPK